MKTVRVIFMGTDEIGVNLLKALKKTVGIDLVQVVTGQDKAVGRKLEITPNAIKVAAQELGAKIFQPENINDDQPIEYLKKMEADFFIVMAYGQLLSQAVLGLPKVDCLNVHTSLLPKYRGASPIQAVILNGDDRTGVSLMKVVKKMDAGPIYAQWEWALKGSETAGELWENLAQLTAEKVPEALLKIAKGKLKAIPQNEQDVSYVKKISKTAGEIDWSIPAQAIERQVRAFNPWPSAYSYWEGKRLKIHQAVARLASTNETPGTVVKLEDGIGVSTGESVLELVEVQLEGKKSQKINDFLNGHPRFVGVCLGC